MRRIAAAISTVLLAAALATASGAPSAAAQAGPTQEPPRDGRLAHDVRDESQRAATADATGTSTVAVMVEGPDMAALQNAIESYGGEVRAVVPGKADAVVPADRIEQLSNDRRVSFVQSAAQYQPLAGTKTSEGVADTFAYTWQNNGKLGANVNVAIVDPAGFQGYANELGDELPASVTTKNFCIGSSGPNDVGSSFTGDAHGTEVAAIVHDMAPAAGIYLICAQDDVGLTQARNFILGVNSDGTAANDIRVVNGSFGNPLQGRGDGSGGDTTADGFARVLRQNDVLFVAAAGNDGDDHYAFSPTTADQAIGSFRFVSWAPNNYDDQITLAPGQVVTAAIKWDAWSGPPQDFDLWLVDQSFNIVAWSTADQTAGATPWEATTYQNLTGSQQTIFARIRRWSASANPRFDTYINTAPQAREFNNAAGSVTIPASSPFAFAAGAYCIATHNLEPYSAQGPTIDGRTKPEISAPDGTSGQVTDNSDPYGAKNSNCTSGFLGTSAAAPHTAGAAALLKSVDPTLTADLLASSLQSMATDAGPNGFDNQFGAGRLSLQLHAIGGPTATTVASQTVSLVRGSDQALWERLGNGTWQRVGGILTSDPDVASMPNGRLDVFGRGADGALWRNQSDNGGATWNGWQSLGGFLLSGPGVVSWGQGRIDVFVRGGDNALWHIAFNGSFTPWQSLGGIITADPDVSSWGTNRLDVFARGSDNGMWHLAWDGSRWSPWESHGGGLSAGPGAASPPNAQTIDVFIRGTDGQVWIRSWNGAQWLAWTPLGGGLVSSPDPAAAPGTVDVVIDGLDGSLWHRKRTGASFTNWLMLDKPAFGPPGSPPP
jgi:subtilisin family serine protease